VPVPVPLPVPDLPCDFINTHSKFDFRAGASAGASMELIEENLLKWNQMGLFPGPLEAPEEFVRRVRYCLDLMHTLAEENNELIPGSTVEHADRELTFEAWKLTQSSYGFAPLWAPLFFSNYRLAPWHGGCAWIFQVRTDTPLGALFQLRREFKTKETFLRIYHRYVLLAHEAVHVARMAYEEPKFEEFLAYRLSPNLFQRVAGPLVQSSRESGLFFLLIVLLLVLDVASLSFGVFVTPLVWLHAAPVIMVMMALARLWVRHGQLNTLINTLRTVSAYPEAIACRMTDREIIDWGKMSSQEIVTHAKKLSESSLRWRVIYKAYFIEKER